MGVLPEPARTIVAVAAFTGLRRGELRGLEVSDYGSSLLHVRRSAWKRHIGDPKGKRGKGAVPVIPQLREILDVYMSVTKPTKYLFPNQKGGPADLDYIVREVIIPTLAKAKMQWHGWHAFRRGLATNLHQLGVKDIVIQAILRHSDVAVTREAYIKRDGVDPQSLAAMQALSAQMDNQRTTMTGEAKAEVVVQ
jgi:integrase